MLGSPFKMKKPSSKVIIIIISCAFIIIISSIVIPIVFIYVIKDSNFTAGGPSGSTTINTGT